MRAGHGAARGAAWLLAALVWPLAGWVLFEGQRIARADWASIAARQQVVRWVGGEAAPAGSDEWEAARSAIQRSLDLVPDSPELQERMGDAYSVAGQMHWADGRLRHEHFARAAAWYESALALRPSEPGTWAMLAAALQARGASRASVQQAWAQARKLGPYEGHVVPMLMQVALADWDNSSPAMQDWAKALFDRASPATQAEINTLAKRYGLVFQPDAVPSAR